LEYVEKRNGQLFPALKADKYGRLGTVFSTWFGVHLTTLGITDDRKVFHSFRHTFIQVCKTKSLHIPPEVREAMVGHVSADRISAEYGDDLYPLDPQVVAMKSVDFAGLDLSHLVRTSPGI
jgi:integrase